MIALIAGSSGLVGRHLTELLLNDPAYDAVYTLVRQAGRVAAHPTLHEIVFDFDAFTPTLPQADHVFCCLGSTMAKAGSKEAFSRIDHDYPVRLGEVCRQAGSRVYALVSAMGANSHSGIFYNKVKGQTEADLGQLGYAHLGIFRPSMLLGERTENRPAERMGQAVMKALHFLIPARYKAVDAGAVARAMRDYAANPAPGISIMESDEIRRH